MIDPEERDSIIKEAVEQALLKLPDVIGNLITSQISLLKINRQFYDKFPDLSKSRNIVASVVERLESINPGVDYQKLLEQAVPLIREQIRTVGNLGMNPVVKPNRDLSNLLITNDHGEL